MRFIAMIFLYPKSKGFSHATGSISALKSYFWFHQIMNQISLTVSVGRGEP